MADYILYSRVPFLVLLLLGLNTQLTAMILARADLLCAVECTASMEVVRYIISDSSIPT